MGSTSPGSVNDASGLRALVPGFPILIAVMSSVGLVTAALLR